MIDPGTYSLIERLHTITTTIGGQKWEIAIAVTSYTHNGSEERLGNVKVASATNLNEERKQKRKQKSKK